MSNTIKTVNDLVDHFDIGGADTDVFVTALIGIANDEQIAIRFPIVEVNSHADGSTELLVLLDTGKVIWPDGIMTTVLKG